MISRLLLIGIVITLLNGCAAIGGTAKPGVTADRQALQDRLAALDVWAIDGRIAIQDGSQGWHASVQWQEQAPRYTLQFLGPFGQGRARVEGGPEAVTLISDRGQVSATDPDQLLAEALGLRLPVKGLRYWIRGLPSPHSSARPAFDDQGRLARLEQDGWIIDYPNYIDVNGLALPKRMRARAPEQQLLVKVIVQAWQLDPPI